MDRVLSKGLGDLLCQRLRAANRELANRWLADLATVLQVNANEIFPSQDLLDHVPALIDEIADCLSSESSESLVANTLVFSKAREMGELRFSQQASVHQIVREYRILSEVLGAFVREQVEGLTPSVSAIELVAVMNQVHAAVLVLLQATLDTFVGRYVGRIEEQTERLDGFNRMVTHELRQPLSSVLHAVQILRMPAGVGQDQRAHFLDVAERNVKRLSQLLAMLSTLALTEPETDNPQLQLVDVSKIIDDVMEQLRESADARGVSLVNAVEPVNLTIDFSRLELVLVNLISNGIKYRDPAKANNAVVEVTRTNDAGGIQLHIRDNGLGIPASQQSRVFRRFFRAHSSRDAELGNVGIGLGLAIAAESVKALKGTLTFQSEEGRGTVFTLALPN